MRGSGTPTWLSGLDLLSRAHGDDQPRAGLTAPSFARVDSFLSKNHPSQPVSLPTDGRVSGGQNAPLCGSDGDTRDARFHNQDLCRRLPPDVEGGEHAGEGRPDREGGGDLVGPASVEKAPVPAGVPVVVLTKELPSFRSAGRIRRR